MEEKIKELIKLLERKQKQIKSKTEYTEGKIDGLNIAIRELERLLK